MYDFFYEKTFKELGGIKSVQKDVIKFSNDLLQIDIKLPNYIFELLTKHGGEYFNNDIEITNVKSVPVASSGKIGIGQFLDISNFDFIKNILKQVPTGIFPILEGSAGDYILIGINNLNYGKIYYWYHEADYDHDLFLIFETFKDFVDNLKIEEDEEDTREVLSFNFKF